MMYAILLVCAVFDLALSYNYFLLDAETFLCTESNGELVNFLTCGAFPFHTFVKFLFALPILIFLLSWFDLLRENLTSRPLYVVERFGRTLTLAIPSLFCVSYSFSGMTWYTNSQVIYELLSIIETMTQGVILMVVFFLFLLTLYLFCDQKNTS